MMQNRIKEIRKEHGISQAKFAEKLGLSRNHIAQVETGKGKFSERTIKDICRIWDISEEWLKTGVGEMHISKDDQLTILLGNIAKGDEQFLESFLEVWLTLDDTSKEALKVIATSLGQKLKERE